MTRAKLRKVAQIPAKLVKTYRFGRGRIVLIDYGMSSSTRAYGGFGLTPQEDYTFHTQAHYDYHHSLVAKAVLWASTTRMPQVRIERLPADGRVLRRSQIERERPVVAIRNTMDKDVNVRLQGAIRNPDNGIEQTWAKELKLRADAEHAIAFALPQLTAGLYYLDLAIKSKAGTEDWASSSFRVTSDRAIQALRLPKDSYERTETLTRRCIAQGRGQAERPRACASARL